MKIIMKKSKLIYLAIGALAVLSCSDFDKINTNPYVVGIDDSAEIGRASCRERV